MTSMLAFIIDFITIKLDTCIENKSSDWIFQAHLSSLIVCPIITSHMLGRWLRWRRNHISPIVNVYQKSNVIIVELSCPTKTIEFIVILNDCDFSIIIPIIILLSLLFKLCEFANQYLFLLFYWLVIIDCRSMLIKSTQLKS